MSGVVYGSDVRRQHGFYWCSVLCLSRETPCCAKVAAVFLCCFDRTAMVSDRRSHTPRRRQHTHTAQAIGRAVERLREGFADTSGSSAKVR